MKVETFEGMVIKGITTRTNNSLEMNPETAQIGDLWMRLCKDFSASLPHADEGGMVYGVYYDFESDYSGDYTLLTGVEDKNQLPEAFEAITIEAGDYLVFEGEGEMPKVVMDTWAQVWAYFHGEGAKPDYQRNYKTDFEYYPSQGEIKIYIGIQQ